MKNKKLDAGTIFLIVSITAVLLCILFAIYSDNLKKEENIKAFKNKKSLICSIDTKAYLVSYTNWQYKKVNDKDYFIKDDFLIDVNACDLDEKSK